MDLKFDFSFKTNVSNTFRQKSLIGQYDLPIEGIEQNFKGDYKLPEKWNIGLIVGNSGTGKTSIAKNAFKIKDIVKQKWNDNAIIDNFNDDLSLDEITYCLGSVGFNSIPYWLKSYNVLSNGEKSRVDLARMLAENDFSIYDEFSSMVDRDVAKSMSNSLQKAFRKKDKQIILLSCHKDIIDWLQPDWVYDTDNKFFFVQTNINEKNSNLEYINAIKNNGIFIKNIII